MPPRAGPAACRAAGVGDPGVDTLPELAIDEPLALPAAELLGPAEHWILERCATTIGVVEAAYAAFQLGEGVGQKIPGGISLPRIGIRAFPPEAVKGEGAGQI